MNYTEMVVFIIYLLFMLSIGIWFFYKNRQGGEKTYFLGGRQMGPWVTALSAGASDMSACAHGLTDIYLRSRPRSGLDQYRPAHRLFLKLDFSGTAPAPFFHCGQRCHHYSAVPQQPLFI